MDSQVAHRTHDFVKSLRSREIDKEDEPLH